MELRHLRYFVTVVEERHFGRAAARLFMSQPPLSQQIQHLEAEIGAQLLDRTTRKVALTAAGESFYHDALRILQGVDDASERARRLGRGDMGFFAVGFVASAAYDILPRIFREFREMLPQVELALHELQGHEQGDALASGRIHVGLSRLPTVSESTVVETVSEETLVAALPASHPLAFQEEVGIVDLHGEPFILYPESSRSRYAQLIFQLCSDHGFEPQVVQQTGEVQTAVSLVAAGIGVTLVPESVQAVHRAGIVYRPLKEPRPAVALSVAYRSDEKSPILPHFLQVVHRVAANH